MNNYIYLLTWTIVILGIALISLEILIPGFGLPGISGIIFFGVGIRLLKIYIGLSLLNIILILGIFIFFILLTIFYMKKSGGKSNLILKNKLTKDKGYISGLNMEHYLGLKGYSKTDLRPSGYVEINKEIFDAVSMEGYILKGEEIKVVKVEASKLFVRRV